MALVPSPVLVNTVCGLFRDCSGNGDGDNSDGLLCLLGDGGEDIDAEGDEDEEDEETNEYGANGYDAGIPTLAPAPVGTACELS
ncbi:hypothetical protein FACS1894152_1440 [Bacilli bacterium]|nr:hypothetical protein FACS1894152_1440 [Bacilli bacterium]